MKPAAFEYHAPETIDDVVGLLAEHGDEAKPLAGGQSLVPMLALRLARFEHVIDLNGVPALAGIERRCRLKDLRHTFGSNLASRGVSLQKIAKAMGHASTRTTERYAKVSEESVREIASALDSVNSAFFSASSGKGQSAESPQVSENNGAGNGARTRDIQLGKLTLYQLSYARAIARNIAEPGQ